jgi:Tol biopolymer transport system component
LVFLREGALFAVPFDVERLEVIGAPIPVVEDVDYDSVTSSAAFTLSRAGTLVYSHSRVSSLVSVDRRGEIVPLSPDTRAWRWVRLSPDGERLLTYIDGDIWVYELERGVLTRLTFDPGRDYQPIWSPDGREIAFQSRRSGENRLYTKPVDGSGAAREILATDHFHSPISWSPDGKSIAFRKETPTTGRDIWILSLEEGGEPWPFLETQFNENHAVFSPDGRWLAYDSDESGRWEVYVQSFPDPRGKLHISTDGGSHPIWAPNRREIFYRNQDKMMAVAVRTQPEFASGQPQVLFEVVYEEFVSFYDVLPDGEHFVMVQEEPQTRLHVVLNWSEELKRLAPTN